MNILILHPSFPGQFVYLAEFLAKQGHSVLFLTKNLNERTIEGVQVGMYKPEREVSADTHAYLKPAEEAVLEGQAVVRAVHTLKEQHGFVPDVAIGHAGWGSLLYLKDLYPELPVISYFEWFYQALNSDAQWWPDEKIEIDGMLRIRTKNAHHLLSLEACDVGFTPTKWQHRHIPDAYKDKVKVIHEGVDTEFLVPDADAKIVLDDIGLDLSDAKEIVTYVARGFEAYRGFPQFMDSVRLLLSRRPDCQVVIIGNDKVCYGAQLAEKSYKQLEEEKGGYDVNRVHFVGPRNRGDYRKILQASHAHIYLTRPFVLSWSMLEAMSIGCPLVASATPPVEEVVVDGENGLLANFRSPEHIAMRVEELLDDRELGKRLGKTARQTILDKYEMKMCVRKQVNLMFSQIK